MMNSAVLPARPVLLHAWIIPRHGSDGRVRRRGGLARVRHRAFLTPPAVAGGFVRLRG
jgi:hypothetical protein